MKVSLKYIVILITMLVSFISLLGTIIIAKNFGFSPENFHDPSKVFDPLTMAVTLGILLAPILIVILSQRFILKKPLKIIGMNISFAKLFMVGLMGGLLIKAIATFAAFMFSTNSHIEFTLNNVTIIEWLPYFFWFLMALFLNSFNEELAYRTFPLGNTLMDRISGQILVLIFAAYFSLMHFLVEPPSFGSFFYRLAFGLLAGGLFLKLRSLWLIVGLHTGWNFVALAFTDSDWRTGNLFQITGINDGYSTWANVFLLTICYALLLFVKQTNKVYAKPSAA